VGGSLISFVQAANPDEEILHFRVGADCICSGFHLSGIAFPRKPEPYRDEASQGSSFLKDSFWRKEN